jgi:serine phosphatase RsbU (regulator of sigma subunit)
MLRAFLYSRPNLAEALAELNAVIVRHELLTGFTTLFCGIYDSRTHDFTYVNCGQESGIICRNGSGEIQLLATSGPVLGMYLTAQYAEKTIQLYDGDTLTLFTDGLTEVGSDRKKMIGFEGVLALLQSLSQHSDGEPAKLKSDRIVTELIAQVDAHAQHGTRDDVCVLIAVVDVNG